jgi:hypothetical protein
VLVVYPGSAGKLDYSLFTGQNWNVNLSFAQTSDRVQQPRLVVDGRGLASCIFLDADGKSWRYARWLGFAWERIREGRRVSTASRGAQNAAFAAPAFVAADSAF